ncbi:MAG: hypothetical protein COB67_00110 [SAR324 cluster bacterium]|uniref:Uncharacterized protein n=1 Tax=SAR324 cluster bacterium TaxID=2024889 RepID=A0A2A4TBH7_9DELT|nr:MAG: hypothetical protein COB67_00110 [SAR324 cluster bacterium]
MAENSIVIPDDQLTPEQLKKREKNRKSRKAKAAKAKVNVAPGVVVQKKPVVKALKKEKVLSKSPAIVALDDIRTYILEHEDLANKKQLRGQKQFLFKNRSGVIRALKGAIEYEPDSFIALTASEYSAVGALIGKVSDVDSVMSNIEFRLQKVMKRGDLTKKAVKDEAVDLLSLNTEFLTELSKVTDSVDKLLAKAFDKDVATRRMKENKERELALEEKDKANAASDKAANTTTTAAKASAKSTAKTA